MLRVLLAAACCSIPEIPAVGPDGHRGCYGGIGIKSGNTAQAGEAVIVKIHPGFRGNGNRFLQGIGASRSIDGDKSHDVASRACKAVHRIRQHAGILGA